MISKNASRYAPAGTFPGTLQKVELRAMNYGDTLLWTFATEEGIATALTGATLNTGPQGASRARLLISAITGVEADTIDGFEEDSASEFYGEVFSSDHESLANVFDHELEVTVERTKGPKGETSNVVGVVRLTA